MSVRCSDKSAGYGTLYKEGVENPSVALKCDFSPEGEIIMDS